MYKVNIESSTKLLGEIKATIVVASKYIDAAELKKLFSLGINNFGENRVEALLEKKKACDFQATWHFIGTLQSRKVKEVINEIEYLHSLDHLSLAKEIQKYAMKPVKCFIEINIAKEETKQGIYASDLSNFVQQLKNYDKIEVVGLMTMAPNTKNTEIIEKVFQQLYELKVELQKELPSCIYLSMGMSNDYQIALNHGATHVRLGRILLEGE